VQDRELDPVLAKAIFKPCDVRRSPSVDLLLGLPLCPFGTHPKKEFARKSVACALLQLPQMHAFDLGFPQFDEGRVTRQHAKRFRHLRQVLAIIERSPHVVANAFRERGPRLDFFGAADRELGL